MIVYLIIVVGLIVLILPWIGIFNEFINVPKQNPSQIPLQNIEKKISDILVFNTLTIDLDVENYSIYLLASARDWSPIEPRRFIHPALRNSFKYYWYIIIKDDLNHRTANKKPQFNVRVYEDGNNDFFDYTTQLILTSNRIELSGKGTEVDSYYVYSKMHLIQVQHDNKKALIRKIYDYYKLNKD
jgi:hypothetical protein